MNPEAETRNADSPASPHARLPWAVPVLKLVPLGESEGINFSLASVDGTSSS